ncbi:carbonic anhydrase, partial [Tremellales sp. Uapishka_1]
MSEFPVLQPYLSSNAQWAEHVAKGDPSFFSTSAKGQAPPILWIGCADSRVPESVVLARKPGEVFVHIRAPSSSFSVTLTSANAVLSYAVMQLGVTHIVVVGHTSCGGCLAAWSSQPPTASSTHTQPDESCATPASESSTPLSRFLDPLVRLRHALPEESSFDDLIEENVKMSVKNAIKSDHAQPLSRPTDWDDIHPIGPPPVPSRYSSDSPADYEYQPSEDDFHMISPEPHPPEEHYYDAELPLSSPPPLQEYPTDVSGSPRRRSKKRTPNAAPLPPLPENAFPPDGQTRFDWRERALSRTKKKTEGTSWYGTERIVQRRPAEFGKLNPGNDFYAEVERYSSRFIPLLKAEQAEEERLFNLRMTEFSLERLTREGYTLPDMVANIDTQPKGKTTGVVVRFSKAGKAATSALPFHRLKSGTTVILSRRDPNVDAIVDTGGNQMFGKVYSSAKGYVKVTFPESITEIEKGSWRLDEGPSDYSFQVQLAAIKALNLDPFMQDMSDIPPSSPPSSFSPPSLPDLALSPRQAEEIAVETHFSHPRKRRKEQTILNGTALRSTFLRAFQEDYVAAATSLAPLKPTDVDATAIPAHLDQKEGILARNQLIRSWTERYRREKPVRVEGDPVLKLNPSQMRAIAMMLSERLSLVQGPPGTGKTRVIIETIKLLKKHWEIPFPILVCAHTNVAVDNVLSGLRDHGVRGIRFGATERVREDLLDDTYEAELMRHPLYKGVEKLQKQVDSMYALEPEKRERDHNSQLNAIKGKLFYKKRVMQQEVATSADVICTTCLSAASSTLKVIDFPMVFLDEASMATEPLSLVPLMKGSSHVAIIGDHKQLPPVIISPDAQEGGLAISLFERLIHEQLTPSVMLDTQYRMHPAISHFPNQAFYASALKDGTSSFHLDPPETEFLVVDPETNKRKNMTFVDHEHPESPMNKSIENYGDVEKVCDIVTDLLAKNPDLRGSQIGIIAPYASQIRLLHKHLNWDEDKREAMRAVIGDERYQEVMDIEIKTVDGFEGREKEVIIFSTVRSNQRGSIGFMADWRRLNVGITRAKRALIIVGSQRTMGKAVSSRGSEGAGIWRKFIAHLKTGGMVLDTEPE